MSARLKHPISIALKPSKIYPLAAWALHGLALVILVVSSTIMVFKLAAALLIGISVYSARKRISSAAQVSQIKIDNHQCHLRVGSELRLCSAEIDQVITAWFMVLVLKPLDLSNKAGRPIYLTIFSDSLSQSDMILLRAYLCSK